MKKKVFLSFILLVLLSTIALIFWLLFGKSNFTCTLENHSKTIIKDVQVVLYQGGKEHTLLQHAILGSGEKIFFSKEFVDNKLIKVNADSSLRLKYRINSQNKFFELFYIIGTLNSPYFDISFEESESAINTVLKYKNYSAVEVKIVDTEKIDNSIGQRKRRKEGFKLSFLL